ncbi:MAG: glycosyltransferase family 9 protein [Bdellovibrionaceae bacterium]|nr:glycosyltransferase family 9 protein [Pseudobdellovibrionaceae bacterium]
MKILIVQLARFGDIFQTWPVISALKRTYPYAEIDVLVRERFSEAMNENLHVSKTIKLSTAEILSSIIINNDEESCLKRISALCSELKNQDYDSIINLSFSPFSSYLVSAISQPKSTVLGYTRFSDGYLCIPDDVSAYFYAQIGIGKANRVHLTQVFAGVAQIDLVDEDWNCQNLGTENLETLAEFNLPLKKFIILQVGASQEEKTYGIDKWSQVINHFKKLSNIALVLVGSSDEKDLGEKIQQSTNGANIINLIGKTNLSQLSQIVRGSCLVVSGDSLLLHVASLTQTPTLCVSLAAVNFWETGPLAPESRIIYGETRDDIASDRVAKEILCMTEETMSGNPILYRTSYGPVAFEFVNYKFEDFSWHLIEAIYMQKPFPTICDADLAHGMLRLNELAQLAIQQLDEISFEKKMDIQVELLSQVDTMLEIIPRLVPALAPLVSWFQTERLRIGPNSLEQVLSLTKSKFFDLKIITDLYIPNSNDSGVVHADTNILT